MKLLLSSVAVSLLSANTVAGFKSPAPASIIQPDPTEYLNWLPNHQGHGDFNNRNKSVQSWKPHHHRPPHYPRPGHCDVEQPSSQNSFWLPNFHGAYEGTSPFLVNGTGYQVFRNVKDFGAVGDGQHDDTAAFNAAITSEFHYAKCRTPPMTGTQVEDAFQAV